MPRKNYSPNPWTPPAKKHRRSTKPKKAIFPKEKPRRVLKRVKRNADSAHRERWD